MLFLIVVSVMKKKKKSSKRLTKPEFFIELYQRKFRQTKIGKRPYYKKVSLESFAKNRFYRIYVVHRPTKGRKLLGQGVFQNLPVKTSGYFPKFVGGTIVRLIKPEEIEKRKHEIKRKFKIGKIKKPRGKWIPINRLYGSYQKEIEEIAKEQGAKAHGIIFPLMNYYHSDWHVFSDTQVNGNVRVRKVYVSIIMDFDYPRAHFISKRHVLFEFPRRVKIKNLHNYEDKIKRVLKENTEQEGVPSNIDFLDVNGFIIME